MKKRTFPLMGLALLAVAGGLELLVVDSTLSGKVPLRDITATVGKLWDRQTTPSSASAQPMYIWKDAAGVTHISETPPPNTGKTNETGNAGKTVKEYQFSPQPAVSAPPPVEPLTPPAALNSLMPETPQGLSASETDKAIEAVRKEREQALELLRQERTQLERQFVRARNSGDGYAQTRFRTLLERNREALEKLAPAN